VRSTAGRRGAERPLLIGEVAVLLCVNVLTMKRWMHEGVGSQVYVPAVMDIPQPAQ
jgi:hypothetical protein